MNDALLYADTAAPDTRTYRGTTLEEILPCIRDELGPDAVITRQREGVVGGVRGFFGKRCLEVEARSPVPAAPAFPTPTFPAKSVVNVYDDGGSLMDDLVAQAAPFADALEHALGEPVEYDEPDEQDEPVAHEEPAEPGLEQDPELRLRELDDVRGLLADAAFSPQLVDELVAEAEAELVPFTPEEPFVDHVRRALTRRLRVQARVPARRRVIALIGAGGAGKTQATIRLCCAFARAGRSVSALSLESVRRAVDLALATDDLPFEVDVADSPQTVTLVREKLAATEIVVVDTPSVDAALPESIQRLGALLGPLRATETHLLMPTGGSVDGTRFLLAELRRWTGVDSLVIGDARGVGVSFWAGLPVSFVATADGLRPAEPEELARMVLP
jgi:flagellar biosynthesis protein FlhF